MSRNQLLSVADVEALLPDDIFDVYSKTLKIVFRDLAAPLVPTLWGHMYRGTPFAPWADGAVHGGLLAFGTEPFCTRPIATATARVRRNDRQPDDRINSRLIVVKPGDIHAHPGGRPVEPGGPDEPAQGLELKPIEGRASADLTPRGLVVGGAVEISPAAPDNKGVAGAAPPPRSVCWVSKIQTHPDGGATVVLTAALEKWDSSGEAVRPDTQVHLRVRPRAVHDAHFGPDSSVKSRNSRAMLLAGRPGGFDLTALMWVLLNCAHLTADGENGLVQKSSHPAASAALRQALEALRRDRNKISHEGLNEMSADEFVDAVGRIRCACVAADELVAALAGGGGGGGAGAWQPCTPRFYAVVRALVDAKVSDVKVKQRHFVPLTHLPAGKCTHDKLGAGGVLRQQFQLDGARVIELPEHAEVHGRLVLKKPRGPVAAEGKITRCDRIEPELGESFPREFRQVAVTWGTAAFLDADDYGLSPFHNRLQLQYYSPTGVEGAAAEGGGGGWGSGRRGRAGGGRGRGGQGGGGGKEDGEEEKEGHVTRISTDGSGAIEVRSFWIEGLAAEQRVVVRQRTDTDQRTTSAYATVVAVSGEDVKCHIDNTPTADTVRATPRQHLGFSGDILCVAAAVQYRADTKLLVVHQQRLLDARVLAPAPASGLGAVPQASRYTLRLEWDSSSTSDADVDLNPFNHCRRRDELSAVDFERIREEYCEWVVKNCSDFEDAITGQLLDIGEQQLADIRMRHHGWHTWGTPDAGGTLHDVRSSADYGGDDGDDGDDDDDTLHDVRSLAYALGAAGCTDDRTRGTLPAQPVLICAKAGAGKSCTVRQLQYFLAKQALDDIREYGPGLQMVPFVVEVQDFVSQLRASEADDDGEEEELVSERDLHLLAKYIRQKIKIKPHARMLETALELRLLVLCIDGLDEAAGLAADMEDYVLRKLAPLGLRLVVTSRPTGVRLVRPEYEGYSWMVLDLEPLTREQQLECAKQQLTLLGGFDRVHDLLAQATDMTRSAQAEWHKDRIDESLALSRRSRRRLFILLVAATAVWAVAKPVWAASALAVAAAAAAAPAVVAASARAGGGGGGDGEGAGSVDVGGAGDGAQRERFYAEICGRPVLLSMVVLVLLVLSDEASKTDAALPATRLGLYRAALKAALASFHRNRGLVLEALRRVAVHLAVHHGSKRNFTFEEGRDAVVGGDPRLLQTWKGAWMQAVRKKSVPLLRTLEASGTESAGAGDGDVLQFKHRSFQEGLLADALTQGVSGAEDFWAGGEESCMQRLASATHVNVFKLVADHGLDEACAAVLRDCVRDVRVLPGGWDADARKWVAGGWADEQRSCWWRAVNALGVLGVMGKLSELDLRGCKLTGALSGARQTRVHGCFRRSSGAPQQ